MKLTVTLSAKEESDVRGWDNYYKAHPEYVGVPPPPNARWPNPNYQSRIVLDSTDRLRFDEITAQMAAPTLPVHVAPDWVPGTDPTYIAQPDSIIAIPYQTGAGPYTVSDVLRGVAAEFQGQPALFMAAINPTAGDMTGAETGVEVGPIVNVTAAGRIKPGSRPFFNICVAPGHPPTKFRFSFPNVPH